MKAVILAGGMGSRLWPMSRDLKPKQFHSFVGKSTMLQQTYERLGAFLKLDDVFVATNEQYAKLAQAQLKELPTDHLILEPAMRDTAPSILNAAHVLNQRGFGEEIMAIVYADHLIQNTEAFENALSAAEKFLLENGGLGIIAVRAKYPNPNLGYIKIGKLAAELPNGLEAYALDRFVEKPDMAQAKKFLTSYKYLWNTGLYLWKVRDILKEFQQHAPEMYEAVAVRGEYEKAEKISIDYSIMEKTDPERVRVFPAELGWNDIGNFRALYEELAPDGAENVASGEHISIETTGSLILSSSGKPVVTFGLKDMVVVDTPEALLIMPKDKAAEVKKVIEALKKNGKNEVL